MHNQKGYPGLNQYGEPSETLCKLDTALRRATDGVYGVRDLGQRGDGSLVVTVIEVEQALREDVRNNGVSVVTVQRPQDFGERTPADRAAYIVEALFDSFIRKERELHVWLGAEKFRELRRGLRHNWMLKHGLSDAPQPPPYFTAIERFWFRAIGVEVPGDSKVNVGTVPDDAPESVRRHQRKVADTLLGFPRDHMDVFARDGKECVFIAQPYFRDNLTDLARLSHAWEAKASEHGLAFEFSLEHSWHYPGRTVLLALWLPTKTTQAAEAK